MKLLFIQGSSRLKQDTDGKWYTDGNFTTEVWERYLSYCTDLTIILRREEKKYEPEYAKSKFCKIPETAKLRVIDLLDITKPIYRSINPWINQDINAIISREVRKADRIIIRSYTLYTDYAYKACLKYKKKYTVEVTGFIKEGLSQHSLIGWLIADLHERNFKRMTWNASRALYVTSKALQDRYPCKGVMLGCSDVVLKEKLEEQQLNDKLNRIDKSIIRIGTAAFLDVKWKGLELVIQAIKTLKDRGISNIQYEMIGLGTGKDIIKTTKKLEVQDQVTILGPRTHNEVFNWLDKIDIYIQPSYQEGLCRAIVEAMSRACPVICSDVGGNKELISQEYLFPCGNYIELANRIEAIIPNMESESLKNLKHSELYNSQILDKKRNLFYKEFMTK